MCIRDSFNREPANSVDVESDIHPTGIAAEAAPTGLAGSDAIRAAVGGALAASFYVAVAAKAERRPALPLSLIHI